MIKTFEQFVNEMYSPINEAFQSSKLREIIKTHGMPKWDFNKKMLYDIKDNEIVDVLDNRREYYDKKYDKDGYNGEPAFMIELKDGSAIVISNLGILKSFLNRYSEKEFDELFKKRHAERHKGNLGKYGGDDIHKKHLENVNKINTRRFAERLKPIIPELVEKIKSEIESISNEELMENNGGDNYIEFEIEIGENKYQIYADYAVNVSDEYKRSGEYLCDIEYSLVSFEIVDEDGDGAKNEDLDITSKTYPDLFDDIVVKEVECGFYDKHYAYGVNPSDFV
jgi:hypothetical protein